ncbi:MAG: TIGR03767 family metallophosphoesterase, partial [Frankia sp.]
MTAPRTTVAARLVRGAPGRGGYRPLVAGPGEPHTVRRDLLESPDASAAAAPDPAPDREPRPLVAFVHLSDLHVMDHQSPARVEYLDRYADPDSPYRHAVDEIGSYRPQEPFTAHVVEAMVQAANAIARGPRTNIPLAFAIITGDATDNCQANELAWYRDLLDGGVVRPDSGDPARYQDVADRHGLDISGKRV